ncbi:hypothetical protein D3C86_1541450 [compost metagenome]
MEIVSRQGEKIVRYQASGQVGSGDGIKAGVAYRLKDGSMVYVPESQMSQMSQEVPTGAKP